jgi:hypothetical protein
MVLQFVVDGHNNNKSNKSTKATKAAKQIPWRIKRKISYTTEDGHTGRNM